MDFLEKLNGAVGDGIGLCIGLDPVLERLPERFRRADEPLYRFNLEIIAATSDIAAAYKPNLAFYEAHGADGWRQLEKTVKAVPNGRVVIADAKRGDIGSTAEAYATALFDRLGADAATVNPFLGADALEPFTVRPERGIFVLAVTSNPGGADLQELVVDGEPLYLHVVRMARRLNAAGNVGLVVGATRQAVWPELLQTAENMPLLIPGVGAQGGDIETLRTALRGYPAPALVNASRSIIYASSGDDFASAAHEAAMRLKTELNIDRSNHN